MPNHGIAYSEPHHKKKTIPFLQKRLHGGKNRLFSETIKEAHKMASLKHVESNE